MSFDITPMVSLIKELTGELESNNANCMPMFFMKITEFIV